ncbi:MAG: hypothetical protein IT438_14090 [Phycisphaerales bacterium]|nr:hypothetical protein [Phycisphaerales bacterium]
MRNDKVQREEIEPERLCDAAEAALKAVVDAAQRNGGRWIYPTDLLAFPGHPICLNGFTRDEIEQASAFLVRMGIIEPRRNKAA